MSPPNLTGRDDPNAFPFRQLLVLGLCRICEPIAFMSIFPYSYYMIESFHITDDSNRIALFAGLVTSVFAAAECLGAGFWGNLSDRMGRKPILLTGLAGTGISMLMFGFAPNLPVALIARAVGGALNGNIGVLQTTVNEVVKVEAHQARAFSIMPTVWCLGAIVGSGLGGALADPVRNYPNFFNTGTLFDQFPYLLTNLVCTAVVIFSMIVGVLFLEETHEDFKDRRDIGLEVGDWLLRRPSRRSGQHGSHHKVNYEEDSLIGDEDLPPDYCSTASSPELSPTTVASLPPPAYRSVEGSPRTSLAEPNDLTLDVEEALQPSSKRQRSRVPKSDAFTKQVMFNIIGYGILAYHTISAEQLLPVLLSLPKSEQSPSLPFKFTGGFALSTKAIGGILSVQGLIQMIATIVVFPIVNRRMGSLWTYRCVILLYPLLYFLVPYASLLPDGLKMPAVYAVLVWKVTAQAFAYPSSSIMLANSAPSSRVLGTLNGAAASSASACRAIGPTFSGLLQSAGLSVGALGLPWWVNVLVALSGACLSLFMVEEKRRTFESEKESSEPLAASDDTSSAEFHNETSGANDGTDMCENLLMAPESPILTRMSLDARRQSRHNIKY